jgi:formylglycine-generating enzyme required for sulfatase activity
MAVIFISHSSSDRTVATSLVLWLRSNGFTDIFLDDQSIAGGDKWREALRAAANSCRVVICLISESWLSSAECFGEFMAAWYMGRRIIPLTLLPRSVDLSAEQKTRLARVYGEDQGIDLIPCFDATGILSIDAEAGVADRLKRGLRAAGANTRVGLDPEAFATDAKLRPTPFPGLASFGDDDADAALFYGRSREIAHVLEDLRSMRALRDQRPLVIQGASGAGKSSLLKAGIIPRLRHETPAWLPLRAFRPGADPLLNFAEALSRTLADYGGREAHGVIRDRLQDEWLKAAREKGELAPSGIATLEDALESEGERLRLRASRPGATILIGVDQAEEMARAESYSGEALADYLRVALASTKSPWQLAFTIRTDSFPELQRHRRFQDLEARGYDLRAIPVFRFTDVVEEPAKRYGVEVHPHLVDALIEDAPKADSLPLLAFALQRLWRQYAVSGALTKYNYDKVGGLKGLIEDAAERALRGIRPELDAPLPAGDPTKRVLDLGRSTFVPALVQVNDQGQPIRRVPEWNAFNEDQHELLKRFEEWRLVVKKGTEADGGTVEVAHEALFREWGRLKEWLEPERARLEALRVLQADAAAWNRRGRDRTFLNHREERIAEAEALARHAEFSRQIGDEEREYLYACRRAELVARARALRTKLLVGLLGVALGAGLVGWWKQDVLKEQYEWRLIMKASVLTTEQEHALSPGQEFSECARGCPRMVVVPAGRFTMGSPGNEEGRSFDEGPQHEVTLAKPFAVGKYDVTFGEWDACVDAGTCPPVLDSVWGRGDRPVIKVSWEDAKLYVAWFSRITGKHYRLLSEAEWEYAARAGSRTRYFFGDDEAELDQYAWYSRNSDGKTQPVGQKKPNAFGLYDMHGNAWQWVEDVYHQGYDGAPNDGSAWIEGGDTNERVDRGGAWDDGPNYVRSAERGWNSAGYRHILLGFRVARTLTP